jgi:hypothetical protein
VVKHRTSSVAIALACGAAAIAGCGGSDSKPRGSANVNPQLQAAQCMRAHGVPNFPDPAAGPGGEGFSVNGSPGSTTLTVDGIEFGGPAFTAAAKTCRFGPGGGPPPQPGEAEREVAIKTAQCMRTHGVPNFPDPDFGGNQGGKVVLPGSGSPAFQRAVQICRAGNRRIG